MDQIGAAKNSLPSQLPSQASPTSYVSEDVGAGRAGVVVGKPGEGGEKASFQEVWSQIQAKMGAKPEKPREVHKTLDKDDFLKIMITQMQHQDPTKPFDAEKMATQMAQITSVEQMQNMNKTLSAMTQQNRPLERLAMTSLIGKTVTVDRSRFAHQEGNRESLSFSLGQPSKTTKVQVLSEVGEVVFEKELGPREAGSVTLDWDGKKKNTMPAGNGNYMLKISATNEQGVEVSTGAVTRTQIVGVSFDGQDPVFIVGDSKRQDRIPMSNVSQIDGGPADVIPDSVKPAAKKMANFFTFKPGEGSKQVDMDQIDPAAAQALERYQQQQLEAKAAPRPSKPVAPQVEEKGFPNGMDVYNTQSKGGEGL